MASAKKDHIIFWTSTILLVLLIALPAVLFYNTQMAIDLMHHLGFPDYFRYEITIAKALGGIALVLPMVPGRLKEWAYVGFGIDFVSALVANVAVDGFVAAMVIQILIAIALLAVSYVYFHKLHTHL